VGAGRGQAGQDVLFGHFVLHAPFAEDVIEGQRLFSAFFEALLFVQIRLVALFAAQLVLEEVVLQRQRGVGTNRRQLNAHAFLHFLFLLGTDPLGRPFIDHTMIRVISASPWTIQ